MLVRWGGVGRLRLIILAKDLIWRAAAVWLDRAETFTATKNRYGGTGSRRAPAHREGRGQLAPLYSDPAGQPAARGRGWGLRLLLSREKRGGQISRLTRRCAEPSLERVIEPGELRITEQPGDLLERVAPIFEVANSEAAP